MNVLRHRTKNLKYRSYFALFEFNESNESNKSRKEHKDVQWADDHDHTKYRDWSGINESFQSS